jgi:hypothetical protein
MPSIAYADRSPQGDQEYKVHQVVGESGSGYEITAFTKMWLPKASMDPKLERKYWAELGCKIRIERDGSIVGRSTSDIFTRYEGAKGD